jgi:hypothetical protein
LTGFFKNKAGEQVFILGLQSHNSSDGCWEMIDRSIAAVKLYGGNTLETPIYWYQVEPEEGVYDFSMLEQLLQRVRNAGLYLVPLWFGFSKNAENTYMPDWVKADPVRFKWTIGPDGATRANMSPHDNAVYEADARCFARLMQQIRRLDGDTGTILTVQVENEIGLGLFDTDRCYSKQAQRDFELGVPSELDGVELEGSEAPGGGSDWYSRFGHFAHEAFTTYYLSRQVERIARAGKAEYDLPLYMNTMVGEVRQEIAGFSYSSGTPCGRTLDIWRRTAPSIDLYCPDIYQQDSSGYLRTCQRHARSDNALFIPESGTGGIMPAMNMLHAIADYGAIGVCGFGAEDTLDESGNLTDAAVPVAESYRACAAIAPLILQYRLTPSLFAVTQEEFQPYAYLKLPNYHMTVHFDYSYSFFGTPAAPTPVRHSNLPRKLGLPEKLGKTVSRGRMLGVEISPDEYYFSGVCCTLRFIKRTDPRQTRPHALYAGKCANELSVLSVEEGHFDKNGRFIVDFVRNGDEINGGIFVRSGTVTHVVFNPMAGTVVDW